MRIRDRSLYFWMGVNEGGKSACWNWLRTVERDGYGRIPRAIKGERRAHRVAYVLYYGPIPDGMKVLHKCDNPLCCNPYHMFLGTEADNSLDMKNKGRQAKHERNGRAVLTEEQVAEVRRMKKAGHTLPEIAVIFDITKGHVSNLTRKRGYAWK